MTIRNRVAVPAGAALLLAGGAAHAQTIVVGGPNFAEPLETMTGAIDATTQTSSADADRRTIEEAAGTFLERKDLI